ncbi:MAG: bifunctional riboflavin kinase/FAD synthetase [Symploca sp. SIO3C6]|uniref:Riboflavin biosynthesis protein n=1 Tax=Symploca sp. SIO1C4 TaxID=2607765 RepID=A0A6B3N7W1_9CYAN|nr:bifunctional riboflavin kinase/FAD synthetase [Symploca sp. SIO3C6]NER26712.1 bifunctional riboflavin kinase/FAD synthetase [Symploca sp. SIO1C4]NET04994.1 bifunctional riboflavin kinase/FAD synthetase [Symploca sp. SIO2B6]
MRVISSLDTALTPTAVALGNFDGIHLGHQKVIAPILRESIAAKAIAIESQPVVDRQNVIPSSSLSIPKEKIESPVDGKISYPYITVATFDPHPREFFSGVACKLLTPRAEKVEQLNRIGVEQLVLLPFDRELAALTPKQFVETILVRQLRVQQVSVGEDFRFGHRRAGTAGDLREIASNYGVEVTIVSLKTSEGERISSSAIRQALEQGEINQANRLLGRPYTLTGVVVKGQGLGRTIGFPTANLQLPPEKFLPKQGVYCVRVWGTSIGSPASPMSGVMNIGERPTVNGSSLTVEFHLLDWLGDLYGQTLTVNLEKFLRPEQKFASLDALKNQIQTDCLAARTFLGN